MRRSSVLGLLLVLAVPVVATGQEAPDETPVPSGGFEPFWTLAESHPAPWAERGSDETVSVAITTAPGVGVVSNEDYCRLVASALFPDQATSMLQLARCAEALNEPIDGQRWLPMAAWMALRATGVRCLAGEALCFAGVEDAAALMPDHVAPPWFGGRVEPPGRGLALTFPADWLVFDPTADIEAQAAAVFSDYDRSSVADSLRRTLDDAVLLTWTTAGPTCDLRLAGDDPARWLDPKGQALLDTEMESDDGIVDYEGFKAVDITDVRASVRGWTVPAERPWEPEWHATQYAFANDSRVALLQCWAEQPPADRWLSIAETFEFRPAE